MKLRMYLRGFGLGIIMTALVMSFGIKTQNSTMTDAQVRQRALELGMVDESTTLASPATVSEESDSESELQEVQEDEIKEVQEDEINEAQEDEITEAQEDEIKDMQDNDAENESVEDADTDDVTTDENDIETGDDTESDVEVEEPENDIITSGSASKDYTLNVQKGFSSDRVAKILEDAGIIDNATSFDKYLCSNGYDKKISVGIYNIPAGADYAAIARIITRSN